MFVNVNSVVMHAGAHGAFRVVLLLASCCAFGCSRPDPAKGPSSGGAPTSVVRIAAASDLRYALPELLSAFRKHDPAIDFQVTYGSSGNFHAQLANKAPFDLFLSADRAYPRQLIEAGLARQESEFVYAFGHLVIWVLDSSAVNVEQLGAQALLDPSIRKVAIANPQHAPYGRAAEAALKTLGMYDAIKDKLVLGDNVAQTAQFIESGAAEIGIIAQSLALAPAMRDKGRAWTIPADAYPKLEQTGVIMNWAQDAAAAEQLSRFLRSDEARTLLRGFGFGTPGE